MTDEFDSTAEDDGESIDDERSDDGAETDAEATERTLIREGRDFEQEYRLDATAAGEFLVELGEGLQSGDEVTISTDEWELPFAFGEPVTLEIDYEGYDDQELEIELEIPGRPDEKAPDVE